MATIGIKVFKHHKKADGTYNIKIRVSHKGGNHYIDTPHYVIAKQLTAKLKVKDALIVDTAQGHRGRFVRSYPSPNSWRQLSGSESAFVFNDHRYLVVPGDDARSLGVSFRKNGIKMAPFQFLLFGNPAKGGVVMQENPLAALDLPLKVIAWQDEKQRNYIAFNDVNYLAGRYSLSSSAARQIDVGAAILKILK